MFKALRFVESKNCQNIKLFVKCCLSLTLVFSSTSFAEDNSSEPYWLFPGETLPGEKSVFPMTVGSGVEFDLNLSERDWFLLKPAERIYGLQVEKSGSVLSATLGYTGPRLNSYNAQMYYRLITGLILKESLSRMGMSSFEAKRYFDSATEKGIDFDKTPLSEMGKLPAVLENLYINFKRPAARQALLPYLITPLAIANHQSGFRHFLEAVNTSDFNQTCQEWESTAPMSWLQNDLMLKKTEIDELDRAYQDALALLKTSKLETVRLTELLSHKTSEESQKTACLNALKNRVNKGSNLPEGKCLETAKAIVEEFTGSETWPKFATQNLLNQDGDFVSLQQASSRLEEIESQISVKKDSDLSQMQLEQSLTAEIITDEATFEVLKVESEKQEALMSALSREYDILKVELLKLQKISSDLDQGLFQSSNDESAVLNAIADTLNREKIISDLKTKIPKILEEKSSVQQLKTVIDTQVNFLEQKIQAAKVQLAALRTQDNVGSLESTTDLETEKEKRTLSYRAALDAFRFSEYVLSLVSKDVFQVETDKKNLFQKIEEEKDAILVYEQKVGELKALRSGELPALQTDYDLLGETISAYTSDSKMGWYFDKSCESKKDTSLFLSRSPLSTSPNGLSAEGGMNGQWGLFNLDYDNYKNSLNSGVALDLQKYISLSVKKIVDHYDHMNVEFYSSDSKCQSLSKDPSQAIQDQIVGTYSMWTGGESSNNANPGFCQLSNQGAENFRTSLDDMIRYEGSLLDQALPVVGVHNAKITLEREAYSWLTGEMQVLTGLKNDIDSDLRREGLIKSLIKVLANDYSKEAGEENSDSGNKRQVQIATVAPGAELYRKSELPIGSIQNVNTIGSVLLYSAPIQNEGYETNVVLSLNDKVEILQLSSDFPDESVMASWVRVKVKSKRLSNLEGKSFWMPAWPLTYDQFVSASGKAIYPPLNEVDCPLKMTVKELTNFQDSDKYVTRLLPEITTVSYSDEAWQMSWRDNQKTTPAYTDEGIYLACELFSVTDQVASTAADPTPGAVSEIDYNKVQGVRLITVEAIKDVDGKTFYVPTENYGGFVHTWIPSRNSERPRIVLGKKLNSDWSKAK